MLGLGITVTIAWTLNPWFILPVLTPLLVMYRALAIPQLKEAAQTGGKTGLLNARYVTERFTEELTRASRFNRPLAVIMADLDFLRTINNTYGHLAGDVVLVGIADILLQTVRQDDLVGRFGGEEFCIVLPDTDLDEAHQLAERLRATIAAARFSVSTAPAPIGATMSLGIARFPEDGLTLTELTHAADVAVYQAKLQGRNRVVCRVDVPLAALLDGMPAELRSSAPPAMAGPSNAPRTDRDLDGVLPGTLTGRELAGLTPAGAGGSTTTESGPVAPPIRRDSAHAMSESRPGRLPAPAQRPAALFHVVVAGVILVGSSVALFSLIWLPPPNFLALGLLALLMVLAEKLQINVYGDNTFSVGVAVLFAAAVTTGLPGVVCVSAANALADHLQQRRKRGRLHKVAYNWATHVLAGAVPALLLTASPVSLAPGVLLGLSLVAAGAAVGYYVIDALLISAAISLSTGTSLVETWRRQFAWLLAYYPVLGVLGTFVGVAYVGFGPLGLLVFTLPLLMMHYVQRQYVTTTVSAVRELKRMNAALTQANRDVQRASQTMTQLNDDLYMALGTLLDARDPYVSGHSTQVARYAALIAEELGLSPERVALLRRAGSLHDIGKIAIPEQVLHKPGTLTADEYAYMQTHAAIGADLLARTNGLQHLAPFVRAHRERWDGQGYPDGLAGEAIPLEARILNVCDSVEAMASDRPYHRGLSVNRILAEVRRCAGTQFDPAVAAAFVRLVERGGASIVVNSARDVERREAEKQLLGETRHRQLLRVE